MNEHAIALIIVLVALVVVPVIFKLVLKKIQDVDYKRQIEGKIPERKYNGSNPSADIAAATIGDEENVDMFKESCDAELRMRGMQNMIGPK